MKLFHPGESRPLWTKNVEVPTFPKLTKNIRTEVCVIGGGAAGLATALELLKNGKQVCVFEDFEIGSGQSGRTTAQLTSLLDRRYFEIEKIHNPMNAILAARSHLDAIEKIKNIVDSEEIECELEKVGAYLYPDEGQDVKNLDWELKALHRVGIENAQQVQMVPFPGYLIGPAIYVPDQYELHPLKFLCGLANAIHRRGGKIFTHTRVTELRGGDDAYVKTSGGATVHCDAIVVATNTPVNDLVALHTKQASYRTYVIAFHAMTDALPPALYYDMGHPYHYIRVERAEDSNHEYVIVGGEDHKTGQNDDPEACYAKLEEWAHRRLSHLGEVAYRWSGQVMDTVDGLAFIGRNPMDKDNVYVITGHSGNGITYSIIGAELITDLILGRETPYAELYDPSRVSWKTAGTYLKENLNSFAQYSDWMMAKQESDVASLARDDGVVFRRGFQMVAAYRNKRGELELHSANCPHLGGVVRWNAAEKSWDCPCHGSRFDCHGTVIEGPANSNLSAIEHTNWPLSVWLKSENGYETPHRARDGR